MRTELLLLTAAAVLSACATAPRKPFAPSPSRPDAAAVYFFRPSEMTGRLLKPSLSANGAALGKLANDTYGVVYLPPGETSFRSVWPGIAVRDDSAALNLTAGQSYFLRVRCQASKAKTVTPVLGGVGPLSFENRPGLEAVPQDEAAPQMAGMGLNAAFGAAPAK